MSKEPKAEPAEDFVTSGFFVVRTPLLPVDELLAWSDGLKTRELWEAGANSDDMMRQWEDNVRILRERLRRIIARAEIAQALYLASPSLASGIEHWEREPDSKKGLQAERSLVRYFTRMSMRPTPFGLFSGCSVGQTGGAEKTTIHLAPRPAYRLCSRLDFDYLFVLTAGLLRDPQIAAGLCYWPNSSLHRVGDAWHYVESRLAGLLRTHHLVKVAADAYLDAALDCAGEGATIPRLAEAVRGQSAEGEISNEEAASYIQELIDSEVLTPGLRPPVTGVSTLDDLIAQLETIPAGETAAETLRNVRKRMAALDGAGLGAQPEEYREIAGTLEKLPAEVDRARLYQVDMIKPVREAVLTKPVLDELVRGAEVLFRLSQGLEPDAMKVFRQSFAERYQLARVRLVDALDEESGLSFGVARTDGPPLVRGLTLGAARSGQAGEWQPLHSVLLRKLTAGARESKTELELEWADLPADAGEEDIRPDSFAITATLIASPQGGVETGDFRLLLTGGAGPDGARLLGRFCHADAELERQVRHHLRQEEAHHPEAQYAEIVHLPEGRIGNVLCRPVLREYEIVYLGRSGAPRDLQLPITDLLVAMENGKLVLYSERLQRRIIPRLTNAHGFLNPQSAGIYRFLCCLQHEKGVGVPAFSWGPLEALEFLPRVRIGRLVLSTARWRVAKEEIDELAKVEKSRRFRAVQELRQRRGLPRWVVLQEIDQTLTVDLNNALSVDAFVHVLERAAPATVREMYPRDDECYATGPEGRFQHELVVPLVRRPRTEEKPASSPAPGAHAIVARAERVLAPGSEWLYLKVYSGAAAADSILVAVLSSVIQAALESGAIRQWFFLRYLDPERHLRIRFQGAPDGLRQDVMPLVTRALQPLLESGEIRRIQFDTYVREIERYGGLEGTILAEEIFCADSEAVLEILRKLEGDEGLDARWRIALLGVDALLGDCGFDLEAKRDAAARLRDSWQRKLHLGVEGKKRLGERFRAERGRIEALFEGAELAFAGEIFVRRSARVAAAMARLRALAEAGRLRVDISELANSYVHMHINRLVRASAEVHELVLYDFLTRLYQSRLVLAKQKAG